MAYSSELADRIREYLSTIPDLRIEEKQMFSGLCFMVNGKMCVNAVGEGLMCRFDPAHQDDVIKRRGFEDMVMRGKVLKGYCYVNPEGFRSHKEFDYWMNLCLEYNRKARPFKRRKKTSTKVDE